MPTDAETAVKSKPKGDAIVLNVTGMSCAGCASAVERALQNVASVENAEVNLAMETARVEVRSHDLKPADLISAVEKAGYGASEAATSITARQKEAAEEDDAAQQAARRDKIMLAGSVLLTLPFIIMMLAPVFGVSFHLNAWTQLALAAPIQIFVGYRFYRGAFHAVRAKTGNMDVLVALGTTAAFALSIWTMIDLGPENAFPLYFEASAVILTLILMGKMMEAGAKRGTTQAIRSLMRIRPPMARRKSGTATEEVPVEKVAVGEHVIVFPGEKIPVDGRILEGRSEVDEALVTGESMPVAKTVDEDVIAGSVNGAGTLEIQVTRIGDDTTLAKIIRLVEAAHSGKAPVQRIVDRLSAIFVPIVLVLAILTFGGWMLVGAGFETAVITAVSVLVIACPCALGLAVPTALVAGTGAAAKAGILIKDIAVLERAPTITVAAFDKTGTLTEGSPKVIDVTSFDGNHDTLLANAAAVQAGSEHPLAKAVVTAAKEKGIEFSQARNIQAHVGLGVSGTVEGKQILIGTPKFLWEEGIDIEDRVDQESLTTVYVASGEDLVGTIAFSDALREQSSAAINLLRDQGVEPAILSGDAAPVVASVGEALGLRDLHARLSPSQKAGLIADWRGSGKSVVMVGDGINDAPALAEADIGIAMGSGTDVAMETAPITLMHADPRLVAAALEIARKTTARVRWNLFWAFAFNVVGLPLAALGYLRPEIAGAAMALSSVSVVTSSLLLRGWKPTRLAD